MNRTPPTRIQLITQLRALTKMLEVNGAQAERMAPLLAARGWPTSTLGDGGSRGTSELTSTERAADHRDRYADADEKLARFYLQTFILVSAGQQLIADLAAHATSDADHEGHDLTRTNTTGGWCQACNRWVLGTADDRIRSGFCSACNMAFARLIAKDPNADRASFIRHRPKHDDQNEPQRIDPTEPSTATHTVAEATLWHHGKTTDITDQAS